MYIHAYVVFVCVCCVCKRADGHTTFLVIIQVLISLCAFGLSAESLVFAVAFTLLVHLISTKLGQQQQLLLLVPLARPTAIRLTDSVTPYASSPSPFFILTLSLSILLINEYTHEYFSGAYLNLNHAGCVAARKRAQFWFFDFRDEQISS